MIIRILAVGKLKEEYWRKAVDEYVKRIKGFSDIEIIEINEEKISSESESNIEIAKREEGKRILEKINSKDYVVLMDINSKILDSIELSERLKEIIDNSNSKIDFVIGGSYGVDESVKNRANFKLSFSKLTFPHQMFRVMLLEQIYRSFTIINNRKYHK